MDANILPSFPPEIEREVFETAATRNREIIPALLLVAHRVHLWLEPLLYRTIIIYPESQRNAFRHKAATFLAKNVQHILFLWASLERDISCLESCRGTRRLALLMRSYPSFLPTLATLPDLRYLSASLTELFGVNGPLTPDALRHPLFAAITHLELFDLDSVLEDVVGIGGLPQTLTHLAVTEIYDRRYLLDILANSQGIRVLLAGYAQQTLIDDSRFVLISLSYVIYEGDWILGGQGGSDFWARADAFVAKKKCGQIKPASRCWIEESDLIN
ncbi:hypothetical protein C8J57DRAFT_1326581 [Mycena rebaudengoi]|nr:hypothetical protein C8J57DRAFT_1326581 [Mycena rebaudengoi]